MHVRLIRVPTAGRCWHLSRRMAYVWLSTWVFVVMTNAAREELGRSIALIERFWGDPAAGLDYLKAGGFTEGRR